METDQVERLFEAKGHTHSPSTSSSQGKASTRELQNLVVEESEGDEVPGENPGLTNSLRGLTWVFLAIGLVALIWGSLAMWDEMRQYLVVTSVSR